MPTACCPASWDRKNGGCGLDRGGRMQRERVWRKLDMKDFHGAVLPGSPLITDLRGPRARFSGSHRPELTKEYVSGKPGYLEFRRDSLPDLFPLLLQVSRLGFQFGSVGGIGWGIPGEQSEVQQIGRVGSSVERASFDQRARPCPCGAGHLIQLPDIRSIHLGLPAPSSIKSSITIGLIRPSA